jgi:WD40 repeat protein
LEWCCRAFWMEYSKDGKILVAVTGQLVRTWDLAGASEKLVLERHTAAVSYVVFSPDGKLLASAGRDHKIKVFNPVTGTRLKELTEFSTPVEGLCFSPDSRVLAAGNYKNGTVRFYDVESWKAIATMRPQVGPIVLSTAFSADGQSFAAAGSNGLTLWRTVRGAGEQPTITFQPRDRLTEEFASSICFSLDGNWLACVSGHWYQDTYRVHVWDLRRSQPHALPIARSRYGMKALGFYPDSRHLAFVSDKPAIAVWDASTEEVSSFGDGQLEQRGVPEPKTHLSADGAWYALGDQTVTVWDMAAKKLLVALPSEPGSVCSVGWSPNREQLAVGAADGGLVIWNLPKIKARLAEIELDW